MTIKIYKMDASPPARAVMMVSDIVNAPVELIDVDLITKKQFTPEFLKRNPLHTVPVMEDGDFILHDSHAILAYLADVYAKDESLYPKEVKQRSLVNQKLLFNGCTLFPRLRSITYQVIIKGDPNVSEVQYSDLAECYGFLESFLTQHKYIAADHMTLADIACIATVSTMVYIVPLDEEKYPKTKAWIEDLESRSFCEKFNKPGTTFLGEYVRNAMKK